MVSFVFQVSGDKPVFVESVKPNGAAYKAGLVAGDMILEVSEQQQRALRPCRPPNHRLALLYNRDFIFHFQVNGNPVRYATHIDVVKLIRGKCEVSRQSFVDSRGESRGLQDSE